MSGMKQIPPVRGKRDLPVTYSREIGRIIVKYAYLENFATFLVYDLAGLSRKMGTLIVRSPRLQDIFEMIEDICDFREIPYDAEKLIEIKTRATKVKSFRDSLAHNTWVDTDATNEPVLVLTRGNWNKGQRKEPQISHKRKAIVPEGVPIKLSQLKEVKTELDNLIIMISEMMISFGLDSSLQKPL